MKNCDLSESDVTYQCFFVSVQQRFQSINIYKNLCSGWWYYCNRTVVEYSANIYRTRIPQLGDL